MLTSNIISGEIANCELTRHATCPRFFVRRISSKPEDRLGPAKHGLTLISRPRYPIHFQLRLLPEMESENVTFGCSKQEKG